MVRHNRDCGVARRAACWGPHTLKAPQSACLCRLPVIDASSAFSGCARRTTVRVYGSPPPSLPLLLLPSRLEAATPGSAPPCESNKHRGA